METSSGSLTGRGGRPTAEMPKVPMKTTLYMISKILGVLLVNNNMNVIQGIYLAGLT